MPKQHGSIEWDDDDLTPGKKKEGGLHQNLFDKDGKLKGSARFIPDEDEPDDWDYEPSDELDPREAAQLEMQERRRELQRQENFELALKAAFIAFVWARNEGKPWWREKAQPAIQATWNKRPRLRRSRRQDSANAPIAISELRSGLSEEVAEADQQYRSNMSSSEAQARLMLALFLRALSDEQLDKVFNAAIEVDLDAANDELERKLAELPQEQVTYMVESLMADLSLIADQLLGFETLLGLNSPDGESQPIQQRRDQ